MTARFRVLPAALLRAGLVAAVLAIMAGILGMHVMTAAHSSHSLPGGAPFGQAAGGHPAGHAAVGHSDGQIHGAHSAGPHAAPAAIAVEDASFTAPGSCGSACPGIQESGTSCIPLSKTGSLAVFPPPTSLAVEPVPAADARPAGSYSYIRSGPTPGSLSISRT